MTHHIRHDPSQELPMVETFCPPFGIPPGRNLDFAPFVGCGRKNRPSVLAPRPCIPLPAAVELVHSLAAESIRRRLTHGDRSWRMLCFLRDCPRWSPIVILLPLKNKGPAPPGRKKGCFCLYPKAAPNRACGFPANMSAAPPQARRSRRRGLERACFQTIVREQPRTVRK